MPVCQWCGELTSKVAQIQNGATVLRLCPSCAGEPGETVSIPEDPDEIPDRPRAWIRVTALVLLLGGIAPVLYALFH